MVSSLSRDCSELLSSFLSLHGLLLGSPSSLPVLGPGAVVGREASILPFILDAAEREKRPETPSCICELTGGLSSYAGVGKKRSCNFLMGRRTSRGMVGSPPPAPSHRLPKERQGPWPDLRLVGRENRRNKEKLRRSGEAERSASLLGHEQLLGAPLFRAFGRRSPAGPS